MSAPEESYGLYNQGSSGWTSFEKEDLPYEEEDVWNVGFHERNKLKSTAAKPIPIGRSQREPNKKAHRQSAPVHIPDWSKIYGGGGSGGSEVRSSWESEEEEGGEGKGMEPPHEWLARKHARDHRISSSSVCEGVGRTLKGRDLSRVRNAVLTKTGFLE
ncbi:unnamed protein product [Cuscuta epithymum]|uniref:Senescence regulator n=1 Tax=Cuscuta epithymum TaxID=186058 RepID=A0AAV0FTK4_9ASTE|nr:unnamed protein product [Cuscuta epithymum]CAH9138831.1 unnamed protein product [Cuscuta epithymum]